MQLWNYKKCRAMADENSSISSDSFAKIKKMRTALIATVAVCAVMLAILVVLTAMHSQDREWDEGVTHEMGQFALTADDCAEYSMEMTEGEYVKSLLVMPVKSITIDIGGETDTYYVYLDNSGSECIFRYEGEMSAEVQNWLTEWESQPVSPPEPVEIIGKRGVMSIEGSEEADSPAGEYDGKSFIDAGEIMIEREVPIEGAEEELARVEAEKKSFEARREKLFAGMCVVFVLLIAALAANIVGKHLYDRARRAFMAELDDQN